MTLHNYRYGLFILLLFILAACSDDESGPPMVNRMIFVYMAGDNSLAPYIYDGDGTYQGNIPSMIQGMKQQVFNGRLLCLVDKKGEKTKLIEITAQGEKVLINYDVNLNTADPQVLHNTFYDAKKKAPALSYGLIMWSHGTGWLPAGGAQYTTSLRTASLTSPSLPSDHAPFSIRPQPGATPPTKAFGQDNSTWMEVSDIEKGLPDKTFDFIIFDACYMASVELLYTLRNKADYFIVSPTEIMASGFPYAKIMTPLFAPQQALEDSLKSTCQKYFDMYNSQSEPYRSASVSLIKSSELDNLAALAKMTSANLFAIDRNTIQKFNRQVAYPCFDFLDTYTTATASQSDYLWQSAIKKAVIFKLHTPYFIELRINSFSGLSTYIPSESTQNTNQMYVQTEWYRATH